MHPLRLLQHIVPIVLVEQRAVPWSRHLATVLQMARRFSRRAKGRAKGSPRERHVPVQMPHHLELLENVPQGSQPSQGNRWDQEEHGPWLVGSIPAARGKLGVAPGMSLGSIRGIFAWDVASSEVRLRTFWTCHNQGQVVRLCCVEGKPSKACFVLSGLYIYAGISWLDSWFDVQCFTLQPAAHSPSVNTTCLYVGSRPVTSTAYAIFTRPGLALLHVGQRHELIYWLTDVQYWQRQSQRLATTVQRYELGSLRARPLHTAVQQIRDANYCKYVW